MFSRILCSGFSPGTPVSTDTFFNKDSTVRLISKTRERVGDPPTETSGLVELAIELRNSWKYSCANELHLLKRDPGLEYSPAGALGPTLSVWCPVLVTH